MRLAQPPPRCNHGNRRERGYYALHHHTERGANEPGLPTCSPAAQHVNSNQQTPAQAASYRGRGACEPFGPRPRAPPCLPASPTEEPGTELRFALCCAVLIVRDMRPKRSLIAQRHADVLLRFIEGDQVVLPHSRPAKVARGGGQSAENPCCSRRKSQQGPRILEGSDSAYGLIHPWAGSRAHYPFRRMRQPPHLPPIDSPARFAKLPPGPLASSSCHSAVPPSAVFARYCHFALLHLPSACVSLATLCNVFF
ncbi:hypothetical protein LX32DRAFT_287358 [Colletotrichum zoysiae]|uniref:Uncharacterized protein n=1 Tax=Colletotrichum zoysiae TaxID=1216348 RepID=A0AAD9LUH2_9PEZI|nr:hypothetical protein LX32DRAFT_287358 [Colletotrichum zoysiae]